MRTRITFASAPVVLSVLILVSVSLVGAEADTRTDFKGNFRGKDANRDGILDRDELITVMTQRKAEAHVPAACKGTQWEERWNATPEMLADGHMEFYDGNGDGVATLSEYIAAHEAKRGTDFVEADADGSGYVNAEELVAAYKVDEAKIHTECRAAIGMDGSETVPEIIEFLDTDKDGKVSMREFMDH
ncbi:MAG: EF-hand domain-containing protein [Tateyamaria sp.]